MVSKMNLDKTVSSILIVILVAAFIATVYIIVNPSSGDKFTELYILGKDNKAGNYPTNLSTYETGNITIGIVNHEQSIITYNLVGILNGKTISNQNITLSKDETKQLNSIFQPTQIGNNQILEYKLYKLPDNVNVYRSVFIHLHVK